MTTAHHSKVLVQLGGKPAKVAKYTKHNTPKNRTTGENAKPCSRCGRTGGHIDKYGLDLCRQCFREIATQLGFKKYN